MTQSARARRARLRSLALVLAVPVIAAACAGPDDLQVETGAGTELAAPAAAAAGQVPAPSSFATPAPAPPSTGLASAATSAAERAAGGSTQLAVAVLDRATGEISVGTRGTEPFYTASLSKVVLAVDILDRRRLEGLAVSERELQMIRRALGPSDDSAMNALWTHFDGPGAAGRVSRQLGLTATTAPRDRSQWGEMSVPAADTVRIWQYILDEIPAADRDLLITAMPRHPPPPRTASTRPSGCSPRRWTGPVGSGRWRNRAGCAASPVSATCTAPVR